MKKTVVLVSGYKRSGKDYFADYVKKTMQETNPEIMSFADPMKTIMAMTLGITNADLETYKNNPDEYGIELKVYPNNQPSGVIEYRNYRQILQVFGTEAMKPIFGDDVWARTLKNKALNFDFVIVPDWRFLIEHQVWDETWNVVTVRIQGGEESNSHKSETELLGFEFDYVINNTKKDEQSIEQFKFFVGELKERLENNTISITKNGWEGSYISYRG